MIAAYLSRAGYDSTVVHTGLDGVRAARDLAPDVVILDLGLPGLDGIEVCRQIRTFTDCYVIVVTARKDEIDTLIGLSVGADDYVTKPFSVRELVARVQAVLRRLVPDPPPPPRPRVVNRPGCSVHYVSTGTASVCTWATSRWP